MNRTFSINLRTFYFIFGALIAIWGSLSPKQAICQSSNGNLIPYLRKDGKYTLVFKGTEQRAIDTAFDWIGNFNDGMVAVKFKEE